MTELHVRVRSVGTQWDELGQRPPRNWTVECSCGEVVRNLPDQMAAFDWWDEHKQSGDTS